MRFFEDSWWFLFEGNPQKLSEFDARMRMIYLRLRVNLRGFLCAKLWEYFEVDSQKFSNFEARMRATILRVFTTLVVTTLIKIGDFQKCKLHSSSLRGFRITACQSWCNSHKVKKINSVHRWRCFHMKICNEKEKSNFWKILRICTNFDKL